MSRVHLRFDGNGEVAEYALQPAARPDPRMRWADQLRGYIDEVCALAGAPHLQAEVCHDLICAWDRHLRRHQHTVAIWRVLRETNQARQRAATQREVAA